MEFKVYGLKVLEFMGFRVSDFWFWVWKGIGWNWDREFAVELRKRCYNTVGARVQLKRCLMRFLKTFRFFVSVSF